MGTADAVWQLTRTRFENQCILSTTSREAEEQQLVLQRNGFSFDLIGTDPSEVGMSTARRKIVELLKSDKNGLWPRQVAEALGKKEGTVRMAIKRMTDDGITVQDQSGNYRLTPHYYTHSDGGDGGE